MKLAYVINAYKLPDQLVRLVKKLNTPDCSFFIHVDRNTKSEIYQLIVGQLSGFENVHFVKRINSKWGQLGLVEAILEGIKEIYSHQIEFDYVLDLSGQDYPITTNQNIQAILAKNSGKSYIHFNPVPYPDHKNVEDFINYWHFYFGKYHFIWPKENMFDTPALNKIWNLFAARISLRRKPPFNFKPFYGSSYWCISHECMDFVVEFIGRNPRYVQFFKYVQYPTEFFFQTILLNSPFKDRVLNDNLRYIDFSAKKANPKVLGKEDFEKFMSSGNLFARKFDLSYDPDVLDMIDKFII